MTTNWPTETTTTPVFDRLREILEDLASLPDFGPIRSEDYKSGYSAARSDIASLIDVGVTDLLSVYEVLGVARKLFEPADFGAFLNRRVAELDGHSPLELFDTGQATRVLELLAAEYEGQVL
jgi:hypothetical protein